MLAKRFNIESALRITKDPNGTWRLMPRAEKVDVLNAGSIAAGRLDEIALLRMQLAEARSELDTTKSELVATRGSLAKSKMTRAALVSYLDGLGSSDVSKALDQMGSSSSA